MLSLRNVASVLLLSMVCSLGCGRSDMPELGEVTGKVTYDGKPLPGVNVIFTPQTGGRPAAAVSDSDGNYELSYLEDYPGCKVGPCRVTLEWSPGLENVPSIPAQYAAPNGLEVEVKAGSQEISIDVVSK